MATGNSGMYLSPHYDDYFPKWRAGMLETLRFAEGDLIQEEDNCPAWWLWGSSD
jgi:acyl-homoserine lactone acylase PvdQ